MPYHHVLSYTFINHHTIHIRRRAHTLSSPRQSRRSEAFGPAMQQHRTRIGRALVKTATGAGRCKDIEGYVLFLLVSRAVSVTIAT